MDTFFGTANLIYWFFVAVVMLAATATLGQMWRRNEAARWTLGYVTVFLLGFPLVFSGRWDANTYLALFFGVGISGAIKAGYALYHQAREAKRIRESAGTDDGYNQDQW